jgi:subtilisin family serine protease
MPGELILRFKSGATAAQRRVILADLGATDVRDLRRPAAARPHIAGPGLDGIKHLRVAGIGVEEAIRRYRGDASVEFIEPNYIYQASVVPDDPKFADQWGLENRGQPFGVPGADIRAPLAWDVTTGSRDVLVAITDTGIDYTHPDLAANVFVHPGEVAGNGVDDDGNGFVDDIRGWDFVNADNDPRDGDGHGTHVSGIVGAIGNNGIGIAGVSWQVRILPLKFLDDTGVGNTANAIRAIDYATDMGARVINASWGGRGVSEALALAIQAAGAAGVLFVAAAGNSGTNNDIIPTYPASYSMRNIIAVAATNQYDEIPLWSSYGQASVDLGAPGENILSTVPGGYAAFSGTSMAAPHVTAALGLIFARYPAIAHLDARDLLLSSVDHPHELRYRLTTAGRLNVHRPFVLPDSIPPAQVTDLAASEVDGAHLELHWSSSGDDGTRAIASYYEVRHSTSPLDETNFASAKRVTAPPPSGLAGLPEKTQVTRLQFATTYYMALVVRDNYGNASPLSNVVTVTTLGPPDVGVSAASLSADLPTGGQTTRTLVISNTGEAELPYAIAVRGDPAAGPNAAARAAAAARIRVSPAGRGRAMGSVGPGRTGGLGLAGGAIAGGTPPVAEAGIRVAPAEDPTVTRSYAIGRGASGAAIETAGIRAASLFADSLRVLLLSSGADVSEIRRLLAGFPDLVAVDAFDGTSSVPTLEGLATYNAVIVAVNVPFADPDLIGDVLADYVDAGGVVVPTLASFVGGWPLGGRFRSGGYSPFTYGNGPGGPSTLGSFIAEHPLMDGVSASTGDLLGDVDLEPGAELVASWANGEPMVATRGGVVGVNLFVGATGFWTGDVPLLLHNAAGWNTKVKWLATDSTSGIVPSGGQIEVVVTFDAAGLDGGGYDAVVAIASDDPDESEVVIPAHLGVTGRPDMAVTGDAVALASLRTYALDGASTTHRLLTPVSPGGSGVLEVVAEGDYSDASEIAGITVEGLPLGSVGNLGFDCAPARARFPLDAALMRALTADGGVDVVVRNGPNVGVVCFPNQHTVRLEYVGPGDMLEFGPSYVGLDHERGLTIRNRGTEVLHVTAIVSDHAAFSPEADAFAIPPRESRRIGVRFHPPAAQPYAGTLVIRSDDPDQPEVATQLGGEGVFAPDLAVIPGVVTENLLSGEQVTRPLTIRNPGATDLSFAIRLESPPPPAIGGATVLLLQDVAPWGTRANEALLEAQGIAFEVIPTTALGGTELARFRKVIVPSDQPTATYDRIVQHAARIEQFVAGGGVLEFHAACSAVAGGDATRVTLPGGMRVQFALASLNDVLEPAHPLVAEVSDPFTGATASRVHFTSIPAGATQVAADDRGRANLVVYPFGRGLVVAGGQSFELGYVHHEGPGRILRNMIPFGFARPPAWLSANQLSGRVAAGAATEVALRLDAAGLLGGDYEMTLVVESNDPDQAMLPVPVRMRVTGIADIALKGSDVALESAQPFDVIGAITRHPLAVPGPAVGEGMLEVEALGDFGNSVEFATVMVEGLRLGEVGRAGTDCVPVRGQFTIAAADMARIVADGVVDAEVRNAGTVDPLCAENQHRVRLTYVRPGGTLEFGPVIAGQCRSLEMEVENLGTDDLNVGALSAASADFAASPVSGFRLRPAGRQALTVTFCPVAAGVLEGTLVLRSDDPDEPEMEVRFRGEGVIPPELVIAELEVEPGTLNLGRRGGLLTCHLEPGGGLDPADIDVASLRFNRTVPAHHSPVEIGDHDGDGIPDLMVKFDIESVRATLAAGEAVRTVVIGAFDGSRPLLGVSALRVTGTRHPAPIASDEPSAPGTGGGAPEAAAATAAAGDGFSVPLEPSLSGAPNPFSAASGAVLRFALPVAGAAEIGVFNAAGTRVRLLADAWLPPGRHEVRWDGRDGNGVRLGPGLYFVRLRAPRAAITRRIVLLD